MELMLLSHLRECSISLKLVKLTWCTHLWSKAKTTLGWRIELLELLLLAIVELLVLLWLESPVSILIVVLLIVLILVVVKGLIKIVLIKPVVVVHNPVINVNFITR
jgi:hypothetical protein